MRFVDAEAVARATPYPALVDALAAAFADPGAVTAPPRAHHPVRVAGEPDRTLLVMPSWDARGGVVVKLVTATPAAAARGLPMIQGVVAVADAETGAWRLVIDGSELTARRTAAASALAARHLAREEAATLAVIGTGRVAREMVAAHASQRPIRRVLVWGRRREAAEAVAAGARALGLEAEAAELEAAVRAADVVACATAAAEPLVRGAWLAPGSHLDLAGAFRRDMRETDAEAVARAAVFVDTYEGARAEAGDLVQAAAEGRFGFEAIRADLRELCAGERPGRRSAEEITLFKSVGASIEDYAAARMVEQALG